MKLSVLLTAKLVLFLSLRSLRRFALRASFSRLSRLSLRLPTPTVPFSSLERG